MTGLKGAKTEISPDGLKVITTAESALAAQAIAARQEQALREEEAGPWGKFNGWFDRVLDRAEETNGIFKRRTFGALAWMLFIGASIMAWNAWFKLLPVKNLDMVLGGFGVLVILAMKLAAARLGQAHREGDKTLSKTLIAIIWGGFVLSVLVSASLQSSFIVDQEIGRHDTDAAITRLNDERELLKMRVEADPGVTEEQQQLVIERYLRTPMVNARGEQLKRTFQDHLRDTECKGSSYYTGIYCPTYFELLEVKEHAKNYKLARERFDAIPAEIRELEKHRPAQSSTLAAVQTFGGKGTGALGGVLLAMAIMAVLDLLMIGVTWLSSRPPAPKPLPEGALA
jgi:hypothetical protein